MVLLVDYYWRLGSQVVPRLVGVRAKGPTTDLQLLSDVFERKLTNLVHASLTEFMGKGPSKLTTKCISLSLSGLYYLKSLVCHLHDMYIP